MKKETRKISPKLLIRRFVLATSFPPFLQIYRAFYALVIHMAVRIFKKYPAIKAVYLRRGAAKGEILPLVSDIDLTVIGIRMDTEDKQALHHAYQKLARATTVLDQKNFEVLDEETFYKLYETNHFFQYRLMEGKATWKLLYGKDYLADLPALPLEKMYSAFFREIKVWWTRFAWRLLQATKYHEEAVTRNNICYKAVSEILKMNLALNHGILTFSRSEALKRAKAHLNSKERALVEKLEAIAQRCFRINDAGIVEETKDFLLTYLDRFFLAFRTHPLSRSLKDFPQRVDCSEDDWFRGAEERNHVAQLVDYIKEKWPHSYRGAYLVPSAYFNLDDMLLMVQVDPQQLPTVRELTALHLLHWGTQSRLMSRINIFLLLPNAAFQIDRGEYPERGEDSILCPSSNPDVFALLGRPSFALDGGGCRPPIGAVWTPIVEHFLRERKRGFYKRLESPSIYELENLDFVRIFWKAVQLVLINRSVQKDEILYPLTLSAVERALAIEGILLPARLQPLADAYQVELEGKASDIKILMPEAIAYLKEIDA